jgi:hypothetical protein
MQNADGVDHAGDGRDNLQGCHEANAFFPSEPSPAQDGR